MRNPAILSTTLLAAVLFGATQAAASATVTLGGERYTIDSVTCNGGPGAFSVQAQATTGQQLLQLGAFDGEVKSVGFRVGDTMAQVSDKTGTFDGTTFRFEGEAQVYTANSFNRKKMTVTATCNGG